MDEGIVREHAQAFADALLAGDVDHASSALSGELRSNLGAVVGLLPLPLTDASIESVQATGSGYACVLRLEGESGTVRLQTRWKERDGEPIIVEASHLVDPVPGPSPEGGPSNGTTQ